MSLQCQYRLLSQLARGKRGMSVCAAVCWEDVYQEDGGFEVVRRQKSEDRSQKSEDEEFSLCFLRKWGLFFV